MVIKQMDALEFVQSLEGGWDCVVWDPPYLENTMHTVTPNFGSLKLPNLDHRVIKDSEYQNKVMETIKSKTNKFILINFFNKYLTDSNDYFIWYKGKSGPITGSKIINNLEFINLYYNNLKPNYKETSGIYRIIEYKKNFNQFGYRPKRFEKPIVLYKKLYSYLNPKYILDPFAGSYNSVKTANLLKIKIDACDKYEKIPKNLDITLNNWIK